MWAHGPTAGSPGHEQGHYVLQHVWMGLGMSLAGLLVALYLVHRLLSAVLARSGGPGVDARAFRGVPHAQRVPGLPSRA